MAQSHTQEECRAIAEKYQRACDMVHSPDNHILEYIRKKGWMDECCPHFKRRATRGMKYQHGGNPAKTSVATKNAYGVHTLEECRAVAEKYQFASDMVHSPDNKYLEYIRKHGWLDVCCSHFEKKYNIRTIPEAIAEVQQYATYQALLDTDKALLSFIRRHGLIEVCLEGMPGYGEKRKHGGKHGGFFLDVPPIEGDAVRRTYKFRIPWREDIAQLMRIANNLYNQTVYEFRTALDDKDNQQWLSHYTLRNRMREKPNLEGEVNYRLLSHDDIADRVIQSVAMGCNAFARQLREHKPGQPWPHPPKYRPKGSLFQIRFAQKKVKNGGRRYIRNGNVSLTDTILIPIPDFDRYRDRLRHLVIGTIIPRNTYMEVALTYDHGLTPDPEVDETEYAAIDIGMQNLVTMVDRHQTTIYHGGFLKSYNQYYNDRMRELRRAVQWKHGDPYTRRMNRLVAKRNAYMNDVMHKVSAHIVQYLQQQHIGVLIIGWNGDTQQAGGLSGNVKRLFQLLPLGKFIDKLQYKCEQVGIHVVLTEESHTSKCDALALEPICHHDQYLGSRVKRGLFRSSTGKTINADVNGAINIMRKVIGDCPYVKDIISKRHLFCPVGYSNAFALQPSNPEQTTLPDCR